jgi:hypothetical protein
VFYPSAAHAVDAVWPTPLDIVIEINLQEVDNAISQE